MSRCGLGFKLVDDGAGLYATFLGCTVAGVSKIRANEPYRPQWPPVVNPGSRPTKRVRKISKALKVAAVILLAAGLAAATVVSGAVDLYDGVLIAIVLFLIFGLFVASAPALNPENGGNEGNGGGNDLV